MPSRALILFVYLVMPDLPALDTLINDDPSALMYKMNPTNSIPVGAIVVKSVCQIRHIPAIEAPILYSTDGDIGIAVIRKATALGTPRVVLTAVAFPVFVEVADSHSGVREPRRAHGGLAFNPGIRARVPRDCGWIEVDWEVGDVDGGGLQLVRGGFFPFGGGGGDSDGESEQGEQENETDKHLLSGSHL